MAEAKTVQTTATLLVTSSGSAVAPGDTFITNDSGASVYIGKDDTVTTSNGLHLPTGSSMNLRLYGGRTAYGIAAAPAEVRVESWV